MEDWIVVIHQHGGGPKYITMDATTADPCCRVAAEADGTVWYPDSPDGWLVVGPKHMQEVHPELYADALKRPGRASEEAEWRWVRPITIVSRSVSQHVYEVVANAGEVAEWHRVLKPVENSLTEN